MQKSEKRNIHQAELFKRGRTGSLTEHEVTMYSGLTCTQEGYACELPMQVHEILVYHQAIENPVLTHCGKESLEVSKSDWVYRMEFEASADMDQYLIKCNGLDTIVEVYLNEIKIGNHQDMFYPFEVEVKPRVGKHNVLLFHFYSPVRYLENLKYLHKEEPYINPAHYIRKAPHDFEDFLGIKPFFAAVGIFEDVVLEEYKGGKFDELAVSYRLDESLTMATVDVRVNGQVFQEKNYFLQYVIEDNKGTAIFTKKEKLFITDKFEFQMQTQMLNVDLWWPCGYGEQALYSCKAYLIDESHNKAYLGNDEVIAYSEKQVGFRLIEFKDAFDLSVNRISVKLWGANLVPINGMTHCFDTGRAETLLQLAKHANMNFLRFWGGGEPYPDELYGMADRAGILIWGEFFHKWGMYPEEEEYMELYRKEARYMITAFRHHPSLIMWCGGNESQMGAELDYPSKPYIGAKIFQQYEALCTELDPEKYYQDNSPLGGAFANDPRKGDFHGWNHLWYVPYDRYPVMFSENSRVSPPILKNLKKYLKDPQELWPPDFKSTRTCHGDSLLPPAWMKLKTGPEPYWCSPVEEFYDAMGPEALIYQCQAAHGQLLKRIGERLRRGRPASDPEGKRRCKGQLIWKLNDSWPQIFCSLLDYDLEGGIPYYTMKRVYEAIQVSFDIDEHITIWVVNDSRDHFTGCMEFVLFNPVENAIVHKFSKDVAVNQGESIIIGDLDHLTQFKRENLLYAGLKNEAGNMIARNYEYVEIEKNFYFPDAKLSLESEADFVIVTTDKFARSIELSGICSKEESRFLFEDNYFDLLPFEKRRIKIETKEKQFTVMAKPYYASKASSIDFNLQNKQPAS